MNVEINQATTIEKGCGLELEKVRRTVHRLIEDHEAFNRRSEERKPFFRPVTVTVLANGVRSFTAFSRDISPTGIGLIHNMPLEKGPVTFTIVRESGSGLSIRGEILWCKPCGESWYISGGGLLEVISV